MKRSIKFLFAGIIGFTVLSFGNPSNNSSKFGIVKASIGSIPSVTKKLESAGNYVPGTCSITRSDLKDMYDFSKGHDTIRLYLVQELSGKTTLVVSSCDTCQCQYAGNAQLQSISKDTLLGAGTPLTSGNPPPCCLKCDSSRLVSEVYMR